MSNTTVVSISDYDPAWFYDLERAAFALDMLLVNMLGEPEMPFEESMALLVKHKQDTGET